MSESHDLEKNRIRFQAKIRTMKSPLENQKHLADGGSKRVILAKNSESGDLLDLSYQLQSYLDGKATHSHQFEHTESTLTSSKQIYDQLESTKPFNKNSLYDSWLRTQNEEISSQVSTKRSEFTDFPEFQKNMVPLIIGQYDSDLEESRILPNYHFEPLQKSSVEPPMRKAYLSRALQQSNTEIINILVAKNQQKKALQKKIFDLEFQMFIQKRNSDKALDTVALSLKNAEGICETQQIQIKRLEKQLKLCQQQRNKMQASHESRVQGLLNAIKELQMGFNSLRKQLEQSASSLDSLRVQNRQLLRVIEEIQREKQNYEKIELLKEKLSNDFELGLEAGDAEVILGQEQHSSPQSHNTDACMDSQQSVESHVSYLQSLIKQYERELGENKRKIKEQKKMIVNLQLKLQDLEGMSCSLQVANRMLADANDELMGQQLKQLNQAFQYDIL